MFVYSAQIILGNQKALRQLFTLSEKNLLGGFYVCKCGTQSGIVLD